MTGLQQIMLRKLNGTLVRVELESLDGRVTEVTGTVDYSTRSPKIISKDRSVTYNLDNGFAIRDFI